MAIIACGGVVTGIRGTVGGVTYASNKAGMYARPWSKGPNKRSNLQSPQRQNLSTLAAQWRNIDPADRADWDTFAFDPDQELTNSLGETYKISGFAWWVKISRELATAGRAPLETGWNVTKPTTAVINTLRVSAGAVTSQITWTGPLFTTSWDCIIEMALAQSIGTAIRPLKPLMLGAWQAPGGTSLDITAAIAARFSTPQVGQRAFAEVSRQVTTGYRSEPYAIAIDVIA